MFTPKQLSSTTLSPDVLAADKRACKRVGPCGIGKEALYLNSFFWERRFYVCFPDVRRVYKRIAMSKGGFTGKGLFGSIPYLVVEYTGGEIQCNFKREEDVDLFLAHLEAVHPEIPRVSEAAERRLAERAAREASRYLKTLAPEAEAARQELEAARDTLDRQPDLTVRLAAAAKAKRISDRTNPTWKWVALAVVLLGAAALVYGIYTFVSGDRSGVYYTLLGLGAVFLFSGSQVLPTARNSRKAVNAEWAAAQEAVRTYVNRSGEFPVPYWYSHPIVLERMIRILREGRAQTAPQALEVLKQDLQALNSSVQVEQEEYDEVVTIKPLFLLHNYL